LPCQKKIQPLSKLYSLDTNIYGLPSAYPRVQWMWRQWRARRYRNIYGARWPWCGHYHVAGSICPAVRRITCIPVVFVIMFVMPMSVASVRPVMFAMSSPWLGICATDAKSQEHYHRYHHRYYSRSHCLSLLMNNYLVDITYPIPYHRTLFHGTNAINCFSTS
jgi:hypothetical protein